MQLPAVERSGTMSVSEAISRRHSVRRFKDKALSLQHVGQVLWAAAGKSVDVTTGATRTAPSAGGCYPQKLYLVAGKVEELQPGIYRYRWLSHALEKVGDGDVRQTLSQATAGLGQGAISSAPATIAFTAVYARSTRRYGKRGEQRYVPMDIGHAGENVYLQATALGLGTVAIGAFEDKAVHDVLACDRREEPLYLMPLGEPAE